MRHHSMPSGSFAPTPNATPFSEAAKAELASIAATVYLDILAQVRCLDGMLQQAGLSRPPEASQLLGVLLPRQEVRS